MKELCDSIYRMLYKDLSLHTAALAVGVILILAHIVAFIKAPAAIEKLKTVPRSQSIGTVILTIDFIWAWVVVSSIDLGDFNRLRWLGEFSVPVVYIAMLFWVNDYLGARAIGILLLLAACPLLDAAFLQPPGTRVILSFLCYVWIVFGLFWVGMPYTMRDQIAWLTRTAGRYKAHAVGGVAYGILLVVAAFTFFKGY